MIINKHIRLYSLLHYRCINLLVKVHFKRRGEYFFLCFEGILPFLHTLQLLQLYVFYSVDCSITGFQPQIPTIDMVGKQGTDLYTLQRLKGLSLAGRGISFTQTDQLREALRDLQLSLQAFPGIHSRALS